MPLPGARVIHPRLHESVRSVQSDRGLPDECTITRPDGGALNPGTLIWTPNAPVVYTGPCRVQLLPPGRVFVNQHGDASVSVVRYSASLPWDTTDIAVDDVLTVTTSKDPKMIGRSFVVYNVTVDTFGSRRFVDLIDRPERVPT